MTSPLEGSRRASAYSYSEHLNYSPEASGANSVANIEDGEEGGVRGEPGQPGLDRLSDVDETNTGFERMESPPPEPEEAACSRWRGRIFSTILFGASVAVRATNYARWTNVIGSFGSGFFSGYGISSGVEGVTEARIRQVCLTIFGQATFFALTQVFLNTGPLGLQASLVQALLGQFGLNMGICAKWLIQRGAVRNESEPTEESIRENSEKVEYVGQNVAHAAKIVAIGGCVASYCLSSDPIVRGLASFGGALLGSQVVGERCVNWLDRKIEKNASYRPIKTALLTLGHVVQPLIFIPWQAPGTALRVRTLVGFGAALGFFDGASVRSQMRRIQRIRDEDLVEFRKLEAPGKPNNKRCSFRCCAYRIFRYAPPLLSALGMIGFTIWQTGWKLKGLDSKLALGMTLVGFLSSYALSRKIDNAWNPNERNRCRDRLMYALWASFRILGVAPLFIYYAGTNAVEMDGKAIDAKSQSPYHVAMVIFSWIAYGFSWGREQAILESDRVGTLLSKFPSLLCINAVTMGALYLMRRILKEVHP